MLNQPKSEQRHVEMLRCDVVVCVEADRGRGLIKSIRYTMANFESYGKHVFKGKVAAPYLEKHGLDAQTLDTSAWTHTMDKADKVSS